MVVILLVVSTLTFIIIQLPPGDYVSSLVLALESQGQPVQQARVAALRQQYGLDLPAYQRYFHWLWGMAQGDMGDSFAFDRPVAELIAERLPLTILVSLLTISFVYLVAVPIGIYSAVRQYSVGDYAFTLVGFIG